MKRTVYLVCGVPGSGKTWVCEQLKDKFEYVPHDDHIGVGRGGELVNALVEAEGSKPIITERPFGERILRKALEDRGLVVKPYFIIEPTDVVQERYLKRERRQLSQGSVTRSVTIVDRADEWSAPRGTSAKVLELLRKVAA